MRKTIKTIFAALVITGALLVQLCGSDDDSSGGGDNCTNATNQAVQGNFRGTSFVSPDAFYKELTFGGNTTYRVDIYTKERTDGDCVFPLFDGSQDTILFSIPSLEVQTVTLSETGSNTLNFNRVADGVTEIELAVCGTIEITNYNEATGEIEGTVIARGQEGSLVDGNFTLQLCDD